MDGWMDGWMDGRMDARTGGRSDRQTRLMGGVGLITAGYRMLPQDVHVTFIDMFNRNLT